MAKQVARVFPFRQSALTFSALLSAALFGGFTVQAQQLLTPQPQAPQLIADTASAFSTSAPLPSEPVSSDALPPQALQPPDQYNHVDGQSKRIFGIIPNFRAVNADVHLPPQTVKDKFVTATQDSFDYSSIFIPLAVAGYDYGRNATPEFGSGGVAYGRYLWHSAVDQTSENYMVEFFVPAAFHEDTRYYTLGRGGFLKRSGYSLSRVVVTRSDSGQRVFNFGEVLGAGAGAGISNLYYPSRERTFGNTGSQWGTSIAIDAAGFFVKEFSPDISHALFHAGHAFHLPGTKSD
jgi:hypothetical protein